MNENRVLPVNSRKHASVAATEPSSILHSTPLVDNVDDPRLSIIRALQHRSERDREGLFVIEGLRFLNFALEKNLPIEHLVYAPADLRHPLARTLVSDLVDRAPSVATRSEILLGLANREDPQGIIAVTRQFTQPLAMSTPSAGLCWIAVDTIQSPGNLGTLLRTAECVGAAGLIMVGDEVDPYDSGCVRGSMGAIFHQRLVRSSFDELETWAHRHRAMIVGTSPNAKRDYHRVRYDRPVILYLGSEKRGMAEERQSRCDLMVKIPMVGRSDSLNVGVAGSVMLYELFNQKRNVRATRR
jgi:TrmH family RNA methyltransferase